MRTWTCARFDELKAADRLPTPSGVALSLLRLTAAQSSSAQEIAAVLETDPALVGRAIKLANSVAAGGGRPVASAREAVVRLGLHTISNLALGFWLVAQSRNQACKRFDYTRYWQQSLAIAVIAKAMAGHVGLAAEEAFTCGLLTQVGRLALATAYPEAYAEILARCERDGIELLAQLERERFATDHTEVTVAMLEDWGLPAEYAEAVFFQSVGADNLRPGSHTGNLARVLDLGCQLSRAWLAADDERQRVLPQCLARGEKLGIARDALLNSADLAMAEWHKWGKLFQVATPEVPQFGELAERAATVPPTKSAVSAETRSHDEGLRILLVSKTPGILETLHAHLAAAGHLPLCANGRDEALPKMLQEFPQVLVLDDFHAGTEADALCRHLRQARLGRYLYVLALTDSPEPSVMAAIFGAGADDFLLKPVDPCLLAARLQASQRIIALQEDAHRDKEEMRRFAMELAVANRRLHHAAYEDALTRLPNRRFGLERLTQEWARAARTSQRLACIMADVDHFKRINDTYGHDIGDEVLQGLADVIRSSIRTSDLACRLGGEEFVILCPDTDLKGAQLCAERLRARVASHRVRSARVEIGVTISMGVAARDSGMKHAQDLLKKADQAVYLAKQSGRDRVCV